MEKSATSSPVPMLFPIAPEEFWDKMKDLIRQEIKELQNKAPLNNIAETPGLTYKPLYKMAELCILFQVSRTTIHDWVKVGKLKPYKIRSRVYFLWNDILQLLHPDQFN